MYAAAGSCSEEIINLPFCNELWEGGLLWCTIQLHQLFYGLHNTYRD